MHKAEIACLGRCDSFGDLNREGSYVRLVYTTDDMVYGIVVSEGAASVLAAELLGAVAQKDDAVLEKIMRNVRSG